jgi:hypothetical protein
VAEGQGIACIRQRLGIALATELEITLSDDLEG